MKQNHLFTYSKICALALTGVSALFLTSCAKDGFDDETFDSGVSNTQVASISAEDIKITRSPDGKSQTISWPVVMGAGGYLVNLIDAGNPEEPIINDSIIDGCSFTTKREEDVNYLMTILTLGNKAKNNTDATETLVYPFSTFTPTEKTIPDGSDLNAWFADNPIPAKAINEMVNYDLEAGGSYTISDVLDFDAYHVTLRTNSKDNHATITYTTEASGITTTAQMGIKYVDFDCSGMKSNAGVFAFSKNSSVPNANEVDPTVYKWAGPLIADPITIVSCNFDNVNGYFFWDNAVKTWAETVLVDNCVVRLTPPSANSGGVFWTNKAGQINNLTVSNSTFYEDPDWAFDFKYFYQAGMAKGPDLYVDGTPQATNATNKVEYLNSTFYHVTWNGNQWGNYNGMQSKTYSYWIMKDCIFFDCSPSGVARRFLHGRANQPHAEFANNTYMNADGTFQEAENPTYDTSGTMIQEDPQFANPAIGDFTISGATQVARQTGDPRWLP